MEYVKTTKYIKSIKYFKFVEQTKPVQHFIVLKHIETVEYIKTIEYLKTIEYFETSTSRLSRLSNIPNKAWPLFASKLLSTPRIFAPTYTVIVRDLKESIEKAC